MVDRAPALAQLRGQDTARAPGFAAKMHFTSSIVRLPSSRVLSLRVSRALRLSLLFCACLFPLSPAAAAPPPRIKHVVVFWLKRPGNTADRDQLERASRSFRTLPGVESVEVGRSLPVRRPGIEQPFDLCAIFTFRDRAALDRFAVDPTHRRAVQKVLKPLVRQYFVYDVAID